MKQIEGGVVSRGGNVEQVEDGVEIIIVRESLRLSLGLQAFAVDIQVVLRGFGQP